jgi:hypothetical protein
MSNRTSKRETVTTFIREVWDYGDMERADEYIAARYTILHDPGDPWDQKVLNLAGYKERVRLLRVPFPGQTFVIPESFENENAIAIT